MEYIGDDAFDLNECDVSEISYSGSEPCGGGLCGPECPYFDKDCLE